MLECNGTIIPSDFQTNSTKYRQDCELGTAKNGSRVHCLEKVYDGDYNCYWNHDHERAKNACEYRSKQRKLSASIICLPDLLNITYFVLGLSLYIVLYRLTIRYFWFCFLFSSMSVLFFDLALTTSTMPRISQNKGPEGL